MSDVHEKLRRAFVELFASNTFKVDLDGFDGGGPDYYGVRLENVAKDGSEVELVLTFRAGRCYCCFELCDHFPYYAEHGWYRLRNSLDRNDLSILPLPTLRKVRVIIEKGAAARPNANFPILIHEGSEYQAGPFFPLQKR